MQTASPRFCGAIMKSDEIRFCHWDYQFARRIAGGFYKYLQINEVFVCTVFA